MQDVASSWFETRWVSLSKQVQTGLIAALSVIIFLPPYESSSGSFQRFFFIVNNDDRQNIAWEFVLLELGALVVAFLLLSSHKMAARIKLRVATAAGALGSLLFPPYAVNRTLKNSSIQASLA